MEILLIGGALTILGYNSFHREPELKDGNEEGSNLPAPRFLYTDPKLWTSAPVDMTYRPSQSFFGPNNDPRIRYLLPGGVRVVHSGYNPVVKTNQVWNYAATQNPAPVPAYTAKPIKGTGEKQTVTSNTVFKY